MSESLVHHIEITRRLGVACFDEGNSVLEVAEVAEYDDMTALELCKRAS